LDIHAVNYTKFEKKQLVVLFSFSKNHLNFRLVIWI